LKETLPLSGMRSGKFTASNVANTLTIVFLEAFTMVEESGFGSKRGAKDLSVDGTMFHDHMMKAF
jgi:hypothetical protein